MLPVSANFQAAVLGSHNVDLRVEAWYGGGPGDPGALINPGLSVSGGSVTVDSNSQVRRQITLDVPQRELFPGQFDYSSPLAPYGTILKVYRGVVFPNGTTEWCPLGVFRIDAPATPLEPGVVTVTGSDLSRSLQDARFLQPTNSVTTNQIRVEIARLVRGAFGAAFGVRDLTGTLTLTPALTWDRDRWAAIQQLATSMGAEVVFDAAGACVIRPTPAITDAVVWSVNTKQIAVTGTRQLDRSEVYNIVVASGERTDGTPPVTATVSDTDPSSPTYVNGNFGPVPVFYASPVLTTTAACQAAATTILGKVKSMARRVSFECIVNPAVDAGDVVQVTFADGTSERHIVDSLQIPLTPNDSMRVATRTSTVTGLA